MQVDSCRLSPQFQFQTYLTGIFAIFASIAANGVCMTARPRRSIVMFHLDFLLVHGEDGGNIYVGLCDLMYLCRQDKGINIWHM